MKPARNQFDASVLTNFHLHRPAPVETPAHVAQLSQIPESVAIEPFPGVQLPVQNAFSDLIDLRCKFPFIPILPFPTRTISLALAANASQSIPVPDYAKLALVQGNGDYYVSRNGNAEVPATTNVAGNNAIGSEGSITHSLYRPEFAFFYLGGVTELSFISPNAGTIVQIAFWQTENWTV